MIFLTVGTQLPFDRLVNGVDIWSEKNPDERVVAQIGQSNMLPVNMESRTKVSPIEFDDYIQNARLIVAHAGMGSILTAMKFCKPILIMPRKASLGEHRNDHQLATVKCFHRVKGIYVSADEQSLSEMLDTLIETESPAQISPYASSQLLSCVGRFINSSHKASRRSTGRNRTASRL